MGAGSHNFKIEQGATFGNTIKYEDASGTPINLSGANISLKAKDNRSDQNFVLNLSNGNGITLSNPSGGEFTINLTANQTKLLKFNRADYDLDINISGTVTRLLTGQIQIIKGVG